MTKTYNITGMKCQGCVNTVTEKLSAVKGVDKVQVDLENKQVTIEGKPWKWSLNETALRLFFSAYNLFENPFLL